MYDELLLKSPRGQTNFQAKCFLIFLHEAYLEHGNSTVSLIKNPMIRINVK